MPQRGRLRPWFLANFFNFRSSTQQGALWPGLIQRSPNRVELDAIISSEISKYTLKQLGELLDAHQVGFSPIYDIADIFRDAHFAARNAIVSVPDHELGPVKMQCVVPTFSATPGEVRHAGPSLGQHNDEIYAALGVTVSEREQLRMNGVI